MAQSKQGTAEILTRRIVARLLTWRFLHELPDPHGGLSLVLTARGATCLREWGVHAQSGSQYSLNHPNFRHRWVGTRYLIERGALGDEAYGVQSLITERAPVGRAELTQRFGLLPDGLVLMGYPTNGTFRLADWVKVIWSRFSMHDLER